jgi:transcriptional regulator with XRE-family HTH domain
MHMNNERDIKARFSRLFKTADLTQGEIATKIGATRDKVGQYAIGRTIPPPEYWEDLARLFGVSIEYLATGRENPIIEAYYHLPEQERIVVDKFLFPHGNGHKTPSEDGVKKKKSAHGV